MKTDNLIKINLTEIWKNIHNLTNNMLNKRIKQEVSISFDII